jgi:uncharacterized membrane protein
MAAIIFVVTYLIKFPLPFASGGYLNIGDAPIYLAAYLLGGPAGAVAGALGSAMSDLAAGYVLYAVPTAVIKGAMGFVCGILMKSGADAAGGDAMTTGAALSGNPARRGGLLRFILAAALGGAIMVGGYALFEASFFNFAQAVGSVPFNCIQWVGGVAVATALFPAVRIVERTLK